MTKEELKQFLSASYSKADFDYLFMKAEQEEPFFTMVWELSQELSDEKKWRLLWILDHATEKRSDFIYPILEELYGIAIKTKNESVIRHCIKLILRCPINEDYTGELLERCLVWMNDPKAKISSQCLGLEFFYQTCKLYPEMVPELLAHIDDLLEKHVSAGYKVRLKQIRKMLEKD